MNREPLGSNGPPGHVDTTTHVFELTVTIDSVDEAGANRTLGKLFEAADRLGVAIVWKERRPVSNARV